MIIKFFIINMMTQNPIAQTAQDSKSKYVHNVNTNVCKHV
jgi:hypothetical protein